MDDTYRRNYPLGALLNEGKTKKIYLAGDSTDQVAVVAKDDITAGDGAKHDIIEGKGRLATTTTANVFRLLKDCGVPVAFIEQDSPTSFLAPRCEMLPYEVVMRREAHGSYLKRNTHLPRGHLFPRLVVEFYLKTRDRNWKGKPLVCDDPMMLYEDGSEQIRLFNPAKPMAGQEPFLVLSPAEVFGHDDEWKDFAQMRRVAGHAFLVLEKAWQLQGAKLVDLKVEFGRDCDGHLLLADVIDNDSWRVLENDRYIDKQVYRDGGSLDDVVAKYGHVADVTSQFRVPAQRIILWRDTEVEDAPFEDALGDLKSMTTVVTSSAHKEPVAMAETFHRLVQDAPDSVVIAHVGRSNAAGPALSAMATIPVITVPAEVDMFPDDVWSSLRVPGGVPVMTVLEPENAVRAARQILSARNPRLYAELRAEIESRTVNTARI